MNFNPNMFSFNKIQPQGYKTFMKREFLIQATLQKQKKQMQKQQQTKKKKKQKTTRQWNEKSIVLTIKKVHSQNLISISPLNDDLFYTSSEDNTVRLWDLRVESSVKLIQAPEFKNNKSEPISNCENNLQNLLFVGHNRKVFSFDVRKQNVFTNEVFKRSEEQHFDDISFIKYSSKLNTLAVADDQGDIRIYNPLTLQETGRMDQNHTNICNSIDFIYPEKASSPLLISGGFDCRLIEWDMADNNPLKDVDMNQLFAKYQIQILNTLPFIHHIFCYQNSILISLESGHIIGTTWNQLRKPKFIMEGNLTKIIQTKVFDYKNLTSMVCLNGDNSFTLFDFIKREEGSPKFIQKYSIPFQGNWIQPIGDSTILVSGYDPALAIYRLKG